ncbi:MULTISPECIES: MaoC/PaaZ C-terminal domain-containing protein [unclassified Geodermatophilus]
MTAVAVGATVPPLERRFDRAGMVAYAGATWDWHRLHHDETYLAEKQLPAPVVDGQLFGALLAEQVQDWLGPSCFVTRLWFRFAGLVFAGETVRCEATVTAVDGDLVTVSSRVVVPASGDRPERPAVTGAGAQVRVAAR